VRAVKVEAEIKRLDDGGEWETFRPTGRMRVLVDGRPASRDEAVAALRESEDARWREWAEDFCPGVEFVTDDSWSSEA
jgi:hypothetical protein